MGLIQATKNTQPEPVKSESGIALFMVIAAMTVLSILVTEFTYVAQVNQRMAYDGVDQLKAHYLAKSGLKLSLLRLKAYVTLKGVASSLGGSAGAAAGAPSIPKSILEKVWNFPFFYPFPTNVPGMSIQDKDRIAAFEKASGLGGKFSAIIDSESSRMNLNMVLAPYAAPAPSPSPGASPTAPPAPGGPANPNPAASGVPGPSGFTRDAAETALRDYLGNTLSAKFEADPDFAAEYRDFRLEDFMDNLMAWCDRTYEKKTSTGKETYPFKKAPFYSLTELHMLPMMDDTLYSLLTPGLTVTRTPGINVNAIKDNVLQALVPVMTKEERADFFKFRDNEEQDNYFKTGDDFLKYLGGNVAALHSDQAIKDFTADLNKKQIRLVTDETNFKITVQAQVNGAVKLIEAWVILGASSPSTGSTTPAAANNPSAPPTGNPAFPPANGNTAPDPGLRITYMRTL